MTIDITVKIGGAAGQGIQTIGTLLATACRDAGFFIMAVNDFESRIRGGHSFFQIRISEKPVEACSHAVDLLVALNRETVDLHKNQLTANGIALADKKAASDKKNIHALSFQTIAKESGSTQYTNTVAAAACLTVLGSSRERIESVLKKHFHRLKETALKKNIDAAQNGVDAAKHIDFPIRPLSKPTSPKGTVMAGSMALAQGVLASDCRFAAFYPMSPATGIIKHMTAWIEDPGMIVEQAEDEIAAANMAIGASFAGVRAVTATSGGGFCLMTEALGLAAMTETPLVIINAQRPGPSTGLPTRTAQGDLRFSIHASQDDFPRFIFAPGTLKQAFNIMKKAFLLSEKYQVPAIVLVDQYFVDSLYILDSPFKADKSVDRFIVSDRDMDDPESYRRYAFTESGVSARALPCRGKALVTACSDEHTPDGHMCEDIENRNAMVEKRQSKLSGMIREMALPESRHLDSDLILTGWGATRGPVTEAVDILRRNGVNAGYMMFTDLWPFPKDAVTQLLKKKKGIIIPVEQNATAQFTGLFFEQTGIKTGNAVLKYDGRPFTPQDIVNAVKEKEFV